MHELIFTEVINWKGAEHKLEFFPCSTVPDDLSFHQCQTVPFTASGDIVMLKHVDGYNSLPGGTVENDETYIQALKREVLEESACTIDKVGVFGYFRDTQLDTGEQKYQLRYWSVVTPLDQPVNDPDGKALERIIIPYEEASKVLGWGEKGSLLISLAKESMRES